MITRLSTCSASIPTELNSYKASSFSLREKARMRGSNKINRFIAIDHLTLTLLCPLGVYALWVLLQGEGTFATPSSGRRRKSAVWPIDPSFSRNSKPPALVGGVFTVLDCIGIMLANRLMTPVACKLEKQTFIEACKREPWN